MQDNNLLEIKIDKEVIVYFYLHTKDFQISFIAILDMTYSIHSNDYKVPLLPSSPNVLMLSTRRADDEHQWC
ncbi:hypothetical protein [Prevotella sp.]|uniref:hypothetical protein n=1 Tax=Prevotella sp. TaxID=59823 RepID=UPI001CB455F0|nr:hypothetical protein [Prevotella sp.]MBF1621766.1 hypothetical protein [Prevotella sp.]